MKCCIFKVKELPQKISSYIPRGKLCNRRVVAITLFSIGLAALIVSVVTTALLVSNTCALIFASMGAVSAAGALIILMVKSRIEENDLQNELLSLNQKLKSLIKERSEIDQKINKSKRELIKLKNELVHYQIILHKVEIRNL
ncbi:MAG: hypothetical protein BGO14_02340 [Chlamydiales bacterium 38-26]|nr:hypothetical protein [Chlamydiales bacterium]OJV08274.1 MAG: hypothetical protein BGO14_02340 [Chlamydiales bacterium 38-26]